MAALAYLALSVEAVPRDELAGLLWPASTRERARGSVRHALWTLRQRLSEDLFETDDPVQLREGRVECDVALLREALKAGRVEEASELWEAAPFEGFRLDDAHEWARWAESVRMELEHRLGSALSEVGNASRDPARSEAGAELLERACQVQPGRLRNHVDLVEALLDVRDPEAAGVALARARALFEDDRSRETLARLAARLEATTPGLAAPQGDPLPRLDFAGRNEEFGALLLRWRQARQGTPGVGLIMGDAGVGKTRLAEEIRLVAESEGGRVVVLKAEDSERPIEWGLLSEVIQRLLRLSGAAGISPASDGVLRSLMPSLALADPARADAGARPVGVPLPRTNPSAALSDALVDLVTAVSDDAPLLLVIDDLHWADTESRTVLARAATRLDRASALLLFTCRSEGEESRIRKTLSLLGEGPASTVVELEPWSFPVMERALRARILFSRPDEGGGILKRLHRTSRGNPLFILELLKVFQEEGIIEAQPDGRWYFRTERLPPDLPLPGSLRALVDRQLDQISREATLVAAHMARIGHATSPRVLGLQTGLGTSAVTNGIGELLARGLIRWEGSDSLTFVHDELRAAVARRYQLHVGLTTGGGAHWSFYRTAVLASVAILLVGAAAYAFTSPEPFGPGPWGGGVISVETPGGGVEALRPRAGGGSRLDRAPEAPSPANRWSPRVVATDDGLHALLLDLPDAAGNRAAETATIALLGSPPRQLRLSPEHRYVAAVLPGPPDTLRLLAEGGRVAHQAIFDEVLDLEWCGTRRLLLLAHGPGGVELISWNPGESPPAPIDLQSVRPGGSLACSPNDRAVVLAGARDGQIGLFLHDLVVGSTVALSLPDPIVPVGVRWTGNRPSLHPVRLLLDPAGPVELDLGTQRTIDGLLVMEGGTRRREPLAWRSLDEDVVTVAPGGRLTAVGPGQGRVEARWGGWLAETLDVHVGTAVGAAPQRAFLDARTLPPGSGEATLLAADDAPFELDEPVPFTVEFEFLVEAGGGRIELCLERDAGGSAGARPHADAPRACVSHPSHREGQGVAEQVSLSVGTAFPATRTRLPGILPSGEWVPGALLVDEAGWVRLFLHDRLRAESAVRLPRTADESWTILAVGRAGDGAVGIRRVRVWEGDRR